MKNTAVLSIVSVLCATAFALPSQVGNQAADEGLDRRAVGPLYGPDFDIVFVASVSAEKLYDPNTQAYNAQFRAHINHHNNAMDIFQPGPYIRATWESSGQAKSNGDHLEHCYTISGGAEFRPHNPKDTVVLCFRFKRWSVNFSSWWLKSTNILDNDLDPEVPVNSALFVNGQKLQQDLGPLV
ncbi:uncharacterized protein L969DRAFT_94709 [Mixia osmundae IAM 14324]|uniref:Uncharacterized protein n=1 Tax=Mixia osmundae (strain CBS 9802 / IAM 14324 / JCM 22182 / KY 12970) TaxID=764103 RepID=G7DVP8_MIXOS|nr:uncharacterized protein L969DRAFT_94709 [Mixia osmundae IAM 14324]KEI39660.1 hypothetical protein L969DRAFT_94709 [Mixia osmundae IAM 14324]GAA94658.1 hypothetical protein E5Q_01311 [Mixia osmundae IAM 14324]